MCAAECIIEQPIFATDDERFNRALRAITGSREFTAFAETNEFSPLTQRICHGFSNRRFRRSSVDDFIQQIFKLF